MTLEEFLRREPTGRFEAMVCNIVPGQLSLRIKPAGDFYVHGLELQISNNAITAIEWQIPTPRGCFAIVCDDDDKLSQEEMLRAGIDQ